MNCSFSFFRRTLFFCVLVATVFVCSWPSTKMVCSQAISAITYPFVLVEHAYIDPLRTLLASFGEWGYTEQKFVDYKSAYHNLLEHYVEQHGKLSALEEQVIEAPFIRQYPADQLVRAQIIGRTFSGQEHSVLIDAGIESGVSEHMCLVYKNCLLGRIIEVFPRYAKAMLITDPRAKVTVFDSQTGAQGMIQGTGNLSELKLLFVNHLATVNLSDLILSDGEGIVVPRGFCAGTIRSINGQDGLYHRISVEPMLDIRLLDHCYVLQKKATPAVFPLPEQTASEQPTDNQTSVQQQITQRTKPVMPQQTQPAPAAQTKAEQELAGQELPAQQQ